MEWNGFELDDISKDKEHREEGEDSGDYEETNFDEDQPLIVKDSHAYYNKDNDKVEISLSDPLMKYFGKDYQKAKDTEYFINVTMNLEFELQTPKYIRYLINKGSFEIKRTVWNISYIGGPDFEVSYVGRPEEDDFGTVHRRSRDFKTENGEISDDDWGVIAGDMRFYYDEMKREELDKVKKKAGIATAIGLSLTALITGLALGLKRSGTDIVHAAKRKKERGAEKLTPAEKTIPWTEIEASGKGLILIGDHPYMVFGGVMIYLYTRRNRRKHK